MQHRETQKMKFWIITVREADKPLDLVVSDHWSEEEFQIPLFTDEEECKQKYHDLKNKFPDHTYRIYALDTEKDHVPL